MGTKVDVAEIGQKGGKARAAAMTKAERSEAARKAVNARWDKARGGKEIEKAVKKRKTGK
jgi:general stress protein YciG